MHRFWAGSARNGSPLLLVAGCVPRANARWVAAREPRWAGGVHHLCKKGHPRVPFVLGEMNTAAAELKNELLAL